MRGAIVGFGNIAEQGHLPAYRKLGVDIVAVADLCPSRRRLAKEYGLRSYSDMNSLVEKEEVDFIDLCTPPNYRINAFKIALEHGLDVMCEKPIAHMSDIMEVKKIARNGGSFFFPVHNWKYAPHYRKIKEVINGDSDIQMTTLRTSYGRGNHDWNPDWRVDCTISGGGILMDHGYHSIYLAMYLMDAEFRSAKLRSIAYFDDSDIEKIISFELAFSKGRRAVINLDWCAGKREILNVVKTMNKRVELLENRITYGDQVYEFEYNLSHDSVHSEWYLGVISEFLEKRNTGDKKFFLEGAMIIEGIGELYEQAEKGR
ncbi:MAG: Gfo/Idh/MocA family oxidoreductase [Candidatus Hydrothermarchaeota archaeon]|jgi:predicted dehydrogenase|nr:Gfo/Idh/MocA family oxidoreductase [Candidatus Hydrothermarchaeota archaeon]